MSEIPTQNEIESQVEAHIVRLEDRIIVTENRVSIVPVNIDPQFATEDSIGLDQVNSIINDNTFRKKLCAGLGKTSDDLGELAKPLVKVLLPVSAIKSGAIALLGFTWTYADLPIGVIGSSLLVIYLARFGIEYFCADRET